MVNGILSAIGNTPLIHLSRFLAGSHVQLMAKLEFLNPGGSIKDRPAFEILGNAMQSGEIREHSVIIESSSGNMGIGLAQACLYYGLRFICVVDPKTTRQNLQLLELYGAQVELVAEPDLTTGEFLQARIQRVKELLALNSGSFWPNQYLNTDNSGAHYRSTMHEIATALDSQVDFLFVATSTCGTVRGCAEYIRDHGMKTRIVAVDAIGSLIFSDVKSKRMIPGLGASLRPPLCDMSLISECVHVSDLDCVKGCRRLMAREAILAGGSSGGVLSAVEKIQGQLPEDAICVVILPDRGERYLETIYCDDWVKENCGEPPLFSNEASPQTDEM